MTMRAVDWIATLADAKSRSADERRLLLTYVYSPG